MEPGLSYTHRLGLVASALLLTISQPWMRLVTPATPARRLFHVVQQQRSPGRAERCCIARLRPSDVTRKHRRESHGANEDSARHSGAGAWQRDIRAGGYHLMCMAPSSAIAPGRSAPITLRFQDGSTLTATFPVYGAKGK